MDLRDGRLLRSTDCALVLVSQFLVYLKGWLVALVAPIKMGSHGLGLSLTGGTGRLEKT
jgi:hypothetical protein